MRHRLWAVSVVPQRLREFRERGRRLRGQRLARHVGAQPLGVAHGPLELVARGGLRQVFERELVDPADGVGPVGVDAEPRHVGDDQERRVLQREGVLPEL
ncbi:MAG: hypothetical protein F4029_05390 [Gammaproteobacteria bacterium]|nr:hypothetical protein [Gammaproteobacteria bacterium]MYK45641.1 hypothetical protein [Gammaproteobacteria bacterium]